MVDVVGREEPETTVAVLVALAAEEVDAVGPAVLDGAEALREVGPVLHGLELGLGERVVVRDVGPGVASWKSKLALQH